MRQRNRLIASLAAGLVLSLAAALSVLAYGSQVAATISVTGPAGNVSCGTTSTIHALVKDTGGAVDTGVPVDWSFTSGNISGDHFSATPTTTNASGIATTTVTWACPSSSTKSNRVVHIDATTAVDISGSIAVTVTVKGLPSTSTDPTSGTSPIAVLAAAFAVIAGSWIILRRVSAARG